MPTGPTHPLARFHSRGERDLKLLKRDVLDEEEFRRANEERRAERTQLTLDARVPSSPIPRFAGRPEARVTLAVTK